jgi:hypothetical protein
MLCHYKLLILNKDFVTEISVRAGFQSGGNINMLHAQVMYKIIYLNNIKFKK